MLQMAKKRIISMKGGVEVCSMHWEFSKTDMFSAPVVAKYHRYKSLGYHHSC